MSDRYKKIQEILETLRGSGLTQEELDKLNIRRRVQDLYYVTQMPGWDVVLDIMQTYPQAALRSLLNTEPGKVKEIIGRHAEAYAANKFMLNFIDSVNTILSEAKISENAVEEILDKTPSPVPPNSI